MSKGRKNKILSVLFLFFILGSISAAIPDKKKIFLKENWCLKSSYLVKEDGKKISSGEFRPKNWYKINIPTTVLTALVKNGAYPDPYVGLNNMKIPDASNEFNREHNLEKYSHLPDKRNPWADPYWFWTQFKLPGEFAGKVIWLNLEGINYRAEVWLNGRLIADSKEVVGMFGEWIFNITKFTNIEEINTFAIKIYPLDYPGLPAEPQLKAFGPFGPNGGPTGDIGKNVTMQCSVGWDWIPAVRDRNMGIWQDIYISATGPVRIRDPFIISDLPLPSTSEAELNVTTEIINLTESSIKGTLTAKIVPENFKGDEIVLNKTVELAPHQVSKIQFDKESCGELLIKNPKLWWPNGQGDQNLYELDLIFEIDGKKADSERKIFGIREVNSKVKTVEGWTRRDFFVNGQKILLKGGA